MQRQGTQVARRPVKRRRATKSLRGRGRARNRRMTVPRNKLGFPQSMRATLRYTDPIAYNLNSVDAVFFQTFLANGMYDPQVALGGHQPRGFDQYMDLYEKFTVLGSTISVNFVYEGYEGPTVETSTGFLTQNFVQTTAEPPALSPVTVGIHKGTGTPAAGTVSEWCEKDKQVWKVITPSSGAVTVSARMKCSDFFGKQALVGSEGYTGNNTQDPVETVKYTVWCGRMSGNNAGLVRLRAYLTIQYDAVFTEPKILQPSR
ncbi:MAG: putative capsid protein [Circoviridae sp.]|nr:MAG: putative capsid protein [Circoviridae sp.]